MAEKRAVFGEDLVVEILLSLPCKSLTRFKCVSKGWYALINSPWFIAKHLSFLNSKNLNLKNLLVMNNTCKGGEYVGGEVAFSLLNLCNNDDESIERGEDRIVVSSVEDLELPLSFKLLTRGRKGCIMGHCNGIICMYISRWILWNPAIQDFKLLPLSPNITENYSDDQPLGQHGFGYDPKLNDYKLVSIALDPIAYNSVDNYDVDDNIIHYRPKVAIYSLSTDSWKEINTNALETETTFFLPDYFQIQFKEMFYWLGDERQKDLNYFSKERLIVRSVIICLDIHNEVFYDIMLPECLYKDLLPQHMTLRVWNNSLALFVHVADYSSRIPNRKCKEYFAIWVMDELGGPTGASWSKHVTLEPTEKPLGFLKTNDILLGDYMELLCSYDLGSRISEEESFWQNSPCVNGDPMSYGAGYDYSSISAIAYVKSIVTVSGAHKLDIRDNSSVANLASITYSALSHSIADREWHSYSIWVIPPYDVSLRIKRVMESLRTDFGGPQLEPHIPIVVSIRMTFEDVLDKFRSLSSKNFRPFQAKFKELNSNDFYYQCLSLLIDTKDEAFKQFDLTTCISMAHFDVHGWSHVHIPRLSLLYGNLTEEERKVAVEKVTILDESISSLSFTATQLALYKINYKDTTLKSWEKVAECKLQ